MLATKTMALEHCGECLLAYGHDEYLYQVFRRNNISLPLEAFYMIRYHSCYPWHSHGAYTRLEDEQDKIMKPAVQAFNRHDLYSKDAKRPNLNVVWPFYKKLIGEFAPGKLLW